MDKFKNSIFRSRAARAPEKKEETEAKAGNYYLEFIGRFAEPLGATPEAKRFYEMGYRVNGIDEPQKYIDGQLKPIFGTLSDKLETAHLELIAENGVKALLAENELTAIDSRLNPAAEHGFLKKIDADIAAAQEDEQDIENTAWPEKALHKMVKNTLEEADRKAKTAPENDPDDLELLQNAMAKKRADQETAERIDRIKRSFGRTTAARHSQHYPPRPGMIVFYYVVSLVLLVAETGISSTIIHDYMDTKHGWSNNMFSYTYAIGMAAGFAMVFKLLIEKTLFNPVKSKPVPFILFVLVAYIVLCVLFAHNQKTHSNDFYKGVILAFFSMLFAMSNAFAFREATYLHDVFLRLKGKHSVEKLKLERSSYIAKWEAFRASKAAELAQFKMHVQQFEGSAEQVRQTLARLQTIAETRFLDGYNDRMKAIIDNNEELTIALGKKMKNYMDN